MDSLPEFLASRIPNYSKKDAEFAVSQCDHIYHRQDGAIGLKEKAKGVLEILFFAADSKETKRELVEEGDKKHKPEIICYHRPKYSDKAYTHGRKFWEKLCHGA